CTPFVCSSCRMEVCELNRSIIITLYNHDEVVLEHYLCRLMENHWGASCFREATSARQVIGLDVGLEDVRDPHGLLSGGFEIGLDIELWIHHSAGSCAPSAGQIAGAAGLWRQEVAKDHRVLLSGSRLVIRQAVL